MAGTTVAREFGVPPPQSPGNAFVGRLFTQISSSAPGQGIFPPLSHSVAPRHAVIAPALQRVGVALSAALHEGNEKASAGGYPADAGQSFVRIGLGLDQAITVQVVSTPRPSSRHILMLPDA